MSDTKVRGAERLARTFGTAASDLSDLSESSVKAATDIRTDAVRRVPKRSGRLARSGTVTKTGTNTASVSFGGRGVQYAGPINFGVGPRVGLRGPHNIRATRFFSGAITNAVPDLESEYLPEINHALDRIKGE